MLNRVQIIGNLGADPEIRTTRSGIKVANLRVACNERGKDGDGNPTTKTEWIPVVIMNDIFVEIVETKLKKGSLVFCEGQFQTRKWTDNTGADRYTTEVFLGKYNAKLLAGPQATGDENYDRPSTRSRPTPTKGTPVGAGTGAWPSDSDDEIPFGPEFR